MCLTNVVHWLPPRRRPRRAVTPTEGSGSGWGSWPGLPVRADARLMSHDTLDHRWRLGDRERLALVGAAKPMLR